MEFVEILALIKKVIFLVGGACVLILLYYKYVKPNKNITQKTPSKEEKQEKTANDPIVRVRRCDVGDDFRVTHPEDVIDIDENERSWIEKEYDPFEDIHNDRVPEERRKKLILELKDLGYTEPENTEGNADPH